MRWLFSFFIPSPFQLLFLLLFVVSIIFIICGISGIIRRKPTSYSNKVNAFYCRHCGRPLDPDSNVCRFCNAQPMARPNFCEKCGAPLNPVQAVCINCGTTVSNSAQCPSNHNNSDANK